MRFETRSARRLLTSVSVAALAGCGVMNVPVDIRDAKGLLAQAPLESRPVTRPVRAVTSFSEPLACMDRMFRDARIGTTLVTSKNIPDASGRMSVATQAMIITALSQMSRVSNAFRYVDYEVDIVRQDTVQNLTGLLLLNNQMQLQRPALYVSGAIAYVDQNVLSNSAQVGTSASRLETGYSTDRNATVIGLELHLGDFRTRTLVPGIDSANEIVFGSRGQGFDVAARISRYGVQFNLSRTTTLGAGASVRTLVDLGMIELLGKWARVPYWQCLMLEQTHPEFQRQLRDWFEEMSFADRVLFAKRALEARSYYHGPMDGVASDEFREALGRFQADERSVVSGELTYETYDRLMRDYVQLDGNGEIARVGWSSERAAVPRPEEAPVDRLSYTDGVPARLEEPLPPPAPPPAPAPLDAPALARATEPSIQIANTQIEPNVFRVGERVYLTAHTPKTSHMYCFYADARGAVTRLYPNPFQRESIVQGNHAIRLPDWLSTNPGYAIEAGTPGAEQTACYFAEQDVFNALPAEIRAPALVPMPNVKSLEQVDAAFSSVKPDVRVRRASIGWQVLPKPEARPPGRIPFDQSRSGGSAPVARSSGAAAEPANAESAADASTPSRADATIAPTPGQARLAATASEPEPALAAALALRTSPGPERPGAPR